MSEQEQTMWRAVNALRLEAPREVMDDFDRLLVAGIAAIRKESFAAGVEAAAKVCERDGRWGFKEAAALVRSLAAPVEAHGDARKYGEETARITADRAVREPPPEGCAHRYELGGTWTGTEWADICTKCGARGTTALPARCANGHLLGKGPHFCEACGGRTA